MTVLEKADQLKNDLDNLRPLKPETEARIMQKFRLDWNYHSNNLEGNSLTYGETKALILFGITAQGKPLKDHFEITGHNEAINWIIDLVKGETALTESFIRQLHALLLKESSYKEALTPDGKPTRRKIEVGKYKTMPNHVVTVTGETFYFAAPEETPAKMHDLIEWFRKERENPDVNPIILAALFHYQFIRIHPFDDGNGRVARILMNFILMQFGYPPVIIKTEDKENYYAVLRLADAGELEPFIEYVTENLIHSLEIMIRGAKGESIEEPDDLDKELTLLEKRLRSLESRNKEVVHKNTTLLVVFDRSIYPLISEFIKQCEKFNKLYSENYLRVFLDGQPLQTNKQTPNEVLLDIRKKLRDIGFGNFKQLVCTYQFNKLKVNNLGKINFRLTISFKFETSNYSVVFKKLNKGDIFKKNYTEQLSINEIEKLVNYTVEVHKVFLEKKLQEIEQIFNQSSP